MGHEMTGRVERLGRTVETDAAGAPLAEDDRIVYSCVSSCGRCEKCLAHEHWRTIHKLLDCKT
jgi:D-arabinose 1-dehydrogenase-like Zn-dependent alcohol dehydrogenase